MPVQPAAIAVSNPTVAATTIERWRKSCLVKPTAAVYSQLAQLFAPINPERLVVSINGRSVRVEPSWFAWASVMVVFRRESGDKLTMLFYDQATERFLQAVAVLAQGDRTTLGSRRQVREPFLRALIAQVRACEPVLR